MAMLKDETIIKVDQLYASFGDKEVLSDVSFTVEKGGVTVILGGSGSGKTTILKHLLGLYSIQKGSIVIFNDELKQISEEKQLGLYLKMGVLFQNGALINALTVGENVSLALDQHTSLDSCIIEGMVRRKLQLVNLEDAFYKFPSELSGGMLKRAALARAIAHDPPLLFCDEPGAGLDPLSLAALDELILNLKKQLGMTIVMVTHEVSSIKRIADKIVFLDKGKIVFEGSLEAALESEQESVAKFFNQ